MSNQRKRPERASPAGKHFSSLAAGLLAASSWGQVQQRQIVLQHIMQSSSAQGRPSQFRMRRSKGAAKPEPEPVLRVDVPGEFVEASAVSRGFMLVTRTGIQRTRTLFPGAFDHSEYDKAAGQTTVYYVPPKVILKGRLNGLRNGVKPEETRYDPDYGLDGSFVARSEAAHVRVRGQFNSAFFRPGRNVTEIYYTPPSFFGEGVTLQTSVIAGPGATNIATSLNWSFGPHSKQSGGFASDGFRSGTLIFGPGFGAGSHSSFLVGGQLQLTSDRSPVQITALSNVTTLAGSGNTLSEGLQLVRPGLIPGFDAVATVGYSSSYTQPQMAGFTGGLMLTHSLASNLAVYGVYQLPSKGSGPFTWAAGISVNLAPAPLGVSFELDRGHVVTVGVTYKF